MKLIKMNRKDDPSIASLDDYGSIAHDNLAKANCFNLFLASEFSACGSSSNVNLKYGKMGSKPMEDIVIEQRGIEILLKQLDVAKACGSDGLPAALLSSCSPSISKYIYVMFNKSLLENALPDDWKAANVPVHKSVPCLQLPGDFFDKCCVRSV